jgi:superoxide dismutase, Cu-Zn family
MPCDAKLPITITALAVLASWGCAPEQASPPDAPGADDTPTLGEVPEPTAVDEARAVMIDSTGREVGEVTFTAENGGVRVQGHLHLEGETPGPRGFHVHEVGECEPPDFESAGGHFDPHGHPHGGRDDPLGERHVGDLGNVEIAEDGSVHIDLVDEVIALDGPDGIVGRALLLHAQEDDLETQPTGDAGDRVACGVIER